MREEEARKKWCPHTTSIVFKDTIYNSRGQYWEGGLPNRCIASDCMMWVHATEYEASGKEKSETCGHCGLIKD